MASSGGTKWTFTRDEIRAKLAELGYHNIPDKALKEFSNDLHGLISAGSGQESIPNIDSYNSSETTLLNSPASTTTSEQSAINENGQRHQHKQPSSGHLVYDDGEHGYDKKPATKSKRQGTQHNPGRSSSRLFVAPDKENQNESDSTPKLAQKRKVLRKKDGQSKVFDESFTNISVTDISDLEQRLHELPVKDEPNNVSIDSDHSDSASSWQAWGKNRNTLPSFIRPRSGDPCAVRKSDPVNRYHQFKQEWSSNKVPGEKMHKHLRWTTREQMLQHETFEKPQHRYIPNNYVAPTTKKRQALRWQVRSTLANF